MSLFTTIGDWIDTGVDWVAEALDYKDIANVELVDTYTAGEQLVRDVKDAFGFIEKPLDAYAKISGLDKKKDEGKYFVPPTQRRPKARSVGALTSGSAAMTRAGVAPTMLNVGYTNPDVRTALTALLNNSYNQQMNNMFANYIVRPTKTTGQKTVGIGSTSVKGVTKKSTTARKSRGLAV